MAVFEYEALGQNGKAVKGVIDADTPAAARRKLRDQQLYPTRVQESFTKAEAEGGDGAARGRISHRDIALMTRQMAVLLEAGMPIVEALGALLNQTPSARLTKIIYDVRSKVNEGSTLADALAEHPRVFPELYSNMVRVGEASGALEPVLVRLADIQEREVRLKKKVISTLMYPLFMALFGVAIVTFLMLVIVPRMTELFQRQGRDLPAITEALIATTDFVYGRWWVIVLAGIGLLALWRAWVARPEGRRQWDRLKLRTPLAGTLYLNMISARFARTLGTMLESGLTLMKALDVVKTVVGNRVVEDALDDVKTGVRRGRDLSLPLKETGVFPPMLIHMVELGQRSGELDAMLQKIAATYDEDVEMTVDTLVGLLEPIIIIVMGLFVGFLVLAILLPILDMSRGV